MESTRKSDLKKARTLQMLNVIYDAIEVMVALIAGITANSSALIGWALDSTIEVISATTLGWRLHGELKGIDEDQVNRRKKITLYVIAVSFTSSWSTMGLIILVTSLLINPILIYFKRKYGRKLDSPALLADAKDTFICLYQTIVVLAGLLLVNWFGWWWADPVAALLIVPYAAKEGWEAYTSKKNQR